jgi:hypothetical protein
MPSSATASQNRSGPTTTDKGGDPVVELQTNFGGGKTHSMLALYHLTGVDSATALPGVEDLMKEVGVTTLPRANRAVLVGTALSPGQASIKEGRVEALGSLMTAEIDWSDISFRRAASQLPARHLSQSQFIPWRA